MILSLRRIVLFVVDFVTGIIGVVLGLDIILKLVGANSATPFVNWIYSWTMALSYPFAGILPNLNLGNGAFLDIVAVVAMVSYTVVTYLFTWLLDSLIANLPAQYSTHGDHVHVQ